MQLQVRASVVDQLYSHFLVSKNPSTTHRLGSPGRELIFARIKIGAHVRSYVEGRGKSLLGAIRRACTPVREADSALLVNVAEYGSLIVV